MCGLAAILAGTAAAAPLDEAELVRIRDAMIARGPDGHGLWRSDDGCVGLAHRRLAIIDLSPAGAQPMVSACGGYRIVFNGEIYNYRALRAELEGQGATFRSHTDTEVILELYRRHGAAMLGRLRGMFAIALWDEARRGLLLARDPFGIKPLYVADDGKTLRAASQVKALLAGGAIDTAPEPAGHAGFFLWGHVPEPFTLYQAIRAVTPGTWLWAGADGRRDEGRFFDLAATFGAAPASLDLPGALRDSVRAHLEADVPVGVFLSSGLDSTTLLALATEAAAAPVTTITLGFDSFAGGAEDEVPLAELAAAAYGADHLTRRVGRDDFAAARPHLLADMDQPTVDGSNTWLVARAARERGLKVALSGLGGDELFGGYDTFRRVPRLVSRLGLAARLPGLGKAARHVLAPWVGQFTSPKAAGILELGGTFGGAYLLRRGLYMPWELAGVLDPDLARAGLERLDPVARLNADLTGIATSAAKVSALETAWYMRNQLLRDSDWAGMAHSLEIRVPLVDVALQAVVAPLIGRSGSPTKRLMAAAARPSLPAAILDRPKTGFRVPILEWLGCRDLRGWAGTVHGAFV
ncbi:MAG: asparagine synthase (glutamine-hydrolyzing) [Alphaproteobacteria bacterium]|nr:asparagine synthase (glutamine-hydrolyzing) [Alphaproteobacteria bacterium]